MKKLLLAFGCIAAMSTITSCTTDMESDSNTLNQKINQDFNVITVDTITTNSTTGDPIRDDQKPPIRP